MVRAIWQGIYQDLQKSIFNGTYAFQALLPSEAQLVALYGCSHNTLRRALGQLADEGLVQPIHGKGVRVIYRAHEKSIFEVGGVETFQESMERLGQAPVTQVKTFESLLASASLARQTGFEEGAELIHIDRVRVFDGEAIIRDDNYFLASVAEGLTPVIAEDSIYKYLEGERGVKVGQAQRRITVEKATPRDYELLDLEDGAYLAVVSSQTFTAEGEMFEYTQSRHRADRFVFHQTARRKV